MRGITLLIAIFLLVPCVALSAQTIKPGREVRVDVGLSSYQGRVRELTTDSLVADTFRLPIQSITRIAVRQRTSNIGEHALYGGIGFGSFGLLFGVMTNFGHGLLMEEEGPSVLATTAVAGSIGALLGAVSSLVTARDNWQRVPLDRLRVSFAARQSGLGLGVTVAF